METSGHRIGSSAQSGAGRFATTHWSVVQTAQRESPAAEAALERLCSSYWAPIYSFVKQHGTGREEAEDLTQAFFALLLERRDFNAVRREKGRLRSYLLAALKHFLANERRRATAVKRGEGRKPVPLEKLRVNELADIEHMAPLSADRIYEHMWASTLVEQVFVKLRDEYQTANQSLLFDSLKELLVGESDRPLQGDVARKLGTTENALRQALHRFRRRYQFLLREEIAKTVEVPGDVEDELRHLIAVLRE